MTALSLTEKNLRWKSRRGILELDLLLDKFWQTHSQRLSDAEQQLLAQWLDLDDDQLWQLVKSPSAAGRSLAQKILPDDIHTRKEVT